MLFSFHLVDKLVKIFCLTNGDSTKEGALRGDEGVAVDIDVDQMSYLMHSLPLATKEAFLFVDSHLDHCLWAYLVRQDTDIDLCLLNPFSKIPSQAMAHHPCLCPCSSTPLSIHSYFSHMPMIGSFFQVHC